MSHAAGFHNTDQNTAGSANQPPAHRSAFASSGQCVRQPELLQKTLADYRSRVDTALEDYLRLTGDDCPGQLRDAMHYSVQAGGKRLRPALTLLACEACGGDIEDALPAAAAVEMIHTYSLIHDDLPAMDDDDVRRGRPTNHKVFGEANAILAGDGLLTLAFELLARHVQPAEVATACCVSLASAAGACGMVGGQVADLHAESLDEADLPSGEKGIQFLESIHHRKTGRLLGAALTMGGRIAQADSKTLRSLEDYGKHVGLAFQIADDLLDVTGDSEVMGKKTGKDADLGKLTYPVLLGIEGSRKRARDLIDHACSAIAPLGERGRLLVELAEFVIQRDH